MFFFPRVILQRAAEGSRCPGKTIPILIRFSRTIFFFLGGAAFSIWIWGARRTAGRIWRAWRNCVRLHLFPAPSGLGPSCAAAVLVVIVVAGGSLGGVSWADRYLKTSPAPLLWGGLICSSGSFGGCLSAGFNDYFGRRGRAAGRIWAATSRSWSTGPWGARAFRNGS